MQLVDESGAQVLPDRRHASTQPNVFAACRGFGLLERGFDAAGDEAELRAAFHRQRRARVMREHENRRVVRRLVAPPPFPAFVRPRAADGAEHVAAEDPGADSFQTLRREIVVHPGFAVRLTVHAPPGARAEEAVEPLGTSDAEAVFEILSGSGAVSVDREGERSYQEARHGAAL